MSAAGAGGGQASGWLSKTDFTRGLLCARAAWYRRHAPQEATPPPPGLALRLADGNAVDAFASEVYAGGVLIGSRRFGDALRETRAAVRAGARRLYQGTYGASWGGCRVDVLDLVDGGAVLREVKASLGLKPEHVWDVAYQVAVLEACGVPVARALVVHLSPEALGSGPRLLTEVDVTAEARLLLAGALPEALLGLQHAVAAPIPPPADRGRRCVEPSPCPFRSSCWSRVPPDGVEWLPGVTASRVTRLLTRGYTVIGEIPESVRLPAVAAEYRRRVVDGPQVDVATVSAWARSLVQPVRSLATVWDRRPIPQGSDAAYAPQLVAFAVVEAGALRGHGVVGDPGSAMGPALLSALGPHGSVVCTEAATVRARLGEVTGAGASPVLRARLRGRLTDSRALAERGVLGAELLASPTLNTLLSTVYRGVRVAGPDELLAAYRAGDLAAVTRGVVARARAQDDLVRWALGVAAG